MKEFINFSLAGSTVTNLKCSILSIWYFFPQRVAGIMYITVNCGAMQIWPETITYLQFSKSSHLKRDSIDYVLVFFFLKYCSSCTCICESCCLSPSFFLWLFFISWTLFPQVALSNSTRKAQGTPRERHRIIQAVPEPLEMGYHRDHERRPRSATKRTRGQGKFWSLKKQAISLVLHSWGFHWKNLCCLFIIARSIILGALEQRAEWQRTWLRISIELFCFYKPISFTDKQWIANHFLFTCGTYVGINELYSISDVIMSNIFIYNNRYLGCNLIFVVQENGYRIFEGFYYGFPWGYIQHLY